MADTPHRGTRNALGQIARPVSVPWKCHQTGDCCRDHTPIVVTASEKELLESQGNLARRFPEFQLHPDEEKGREQLRAAGIMVMPDAKFYQLDRSGQGGCPFLVENSCVVHATRPYNCRRFMCGRVDVSRESYETGGPMGNYNLSDRLNTSLRWMEYYRSNERRAQKDWALEHGWTNKP